MVGKCCGVITTTAATRAKTKAPGSGQGRDMGNEKRKRDLKMKKGTFKMIIPVFRLRRKFGADFREEFKKYLPNPCDTHEQLDRFRNDDIAKMDLLELHRHRIIVENALAFLPTWGFFAFDRHGEPVTTEDWLLARLVRIKAAMATAGGGEI